jgi:hypothetical protein
VAVVGFAPELAVLVVQVVVVQVVVVLVAEHLALELELQERQTLVVVVEQVP